MLYIGASKSQYLFFFFFVRQTKKPSRWFNSVMKLSVVTLAPNESVEKSRVVEFYLHIRRALAIFVRALQ